MVKIIQQNYEQMAHLELFLVFLCQLAAEKLKSFILLVI